MTDDTESDDVLSDVLGGDLAIRYGIEADTGMTPEAIFVEEYLRSGNAFMACNKSGLVDPRYPMEVVARRTLERPEIQAAIALGKKLQSRGGRRDPPGMYSREMILDELQRVHERALDDKSYTSAINAVKTQAQMLGFLDQTVNVNHRVSAKELSLDDLRRMVSERRAGDDAIDITPVLKGIGGD
jgi:hypothetical protein